MTQKLKRILLLLSIVLVLLVVWWLNNSLTPEPQLSSNETSAETSGTDSSRTRLPSLDEAPVSETEEVPDFGDIFDIRERKEAFFSYLLPAIRDENARIQQQRNTLLRLKAKLENQTITDRELNWLHQLATYYAIDTEVEGFVIHDALPTLERRVDVVPETLVLVQAANESGWGMSRFAQDARNFFGQWCWTEGCGIVPNQRPEGQVYEVRLFPSMEASIRSYMRNLNTHFAYQDLRAIRWQMRNEAQSITATPLTHGLVRYSERGDAYVEELQQMIRVNRPIIQEVSESVGPN